MGLHRKRLLYVEEGGYSRKGIGGGYSRNGITVGRGRGLQ